MSEVFITGAPTTPKYRSLIRGSALSEEKRRHSGHRKIVLILTNALELNCFPFTALGPHFDTISFIGRVPESLKNRILITVRTKPGPLGDDPVLYRQLCGLSAESLNILDGLDFSQCIEVVDCVVGINIPTSGYFEVFRKGIPLIHVQTADVISLQPDLPPEIIQRVTELRCVWPAIEAALFDETRRQKILEIQRRFAEVDFAPGVSGRGDPVEVLIRQLLGVRSFPGLNSFLRAVRRWIIGQAQPKCRSPRLDENCLRRSPQGGAGYVDDVLLGSDHSVVLVGWAADMVMRRPAKSIQVFAEGLWIGGGCAGQSRPDVAALYNDEHLEQSGFSIHIRLFKLKQAAAISIYSELHDGTFFELQRP